MAKRPANELKEAAERVLKEGAMPLSEIAKKIPAARRGKLGHVSVGALTRWILEGKQGVYLDGARLTGPGWCSSLAAVARFSAQIAEKELGERIEIESPAERERRSKEEDRRLEELKAQWKSDRRKKAEERKANH